MDHLVILEARSPRWVSLSELDFPSDPWKRNPVIPLPFPGPRGCLCFLANDPAPLSQVSDGQKFSQPAALLFSGLMVSCLLLTL